MTAGSGILRKFKLMNSLSQIELMVPAGSEAALIAAIDAGADSVYFGVGKLNMRARSADFTPDDLSLIHISEPTRPY